MTRIAFLPGDGIGREVLPAAREVLEAAGFSATWVELPVGWDEWRRQGNALPAPTVEAMRGTRAAFFGAITSKGAQDAEAELAARLRGKGLRYASPILALRKAFDLNLNIRPVRAFEGNPRAPRSLIEITVFRENSEDLYSEIESHPTPADVLDPWRRLGYAPPQLPPAGDDTALSMRVITRGRTRALMDAAFAHAAQMKRRRVSLLEKANVMRKTGGLVIEEFRRAAKRHPEIEAEELQVDAACALCVRDPTRFDVVVATNLFGDIFSDLAAEVAGGLGLAPSANIGPHYALFEPVHGSAPDIAGRGTANPVAAVLSGALLARHVGQPDVADLLEGAVASWFKAGGPFPSDLGGRATTVEVVKRLSSLIAA